MRTIGRYRICGMLGRGGMGVVYKALLPVVDRVVALKVLEPEDAMEAVVGMDALRDQFMREARIMSSLVHPHIAGIWDASEGDADTPAHFVMEYFCSNLGIVLGESYRADIPSRRLPVERGVQYALQMLDGLGRMHHAGVIHRDIKPFNLLLTDDDQIRIIDFGLSRLRGEASPSAPDNIKIGTPFYTAPEQERTPELAGPPADLFSAGVVLFRMLTGRIPSLEAFEDEDGRKEPVAVGQWDIPLASSLCSDLGTEWDSFFEQALAPDPGQRFQDAVQMRRELSRLLLGWRDRLDTVCHLLEEEEQQADARHGAMRCSPRCVARTAPVKVMPSSGYAVLELDSLGVPLQLVENNWSDTTGWDAFAADQTTTVVDRATGLEWMRSGSDYPLQWGEAGEYIAAMNELRYAGHADWRLPTVAELATLVDGPEQLEDMCQPPVFDPAQSRLWSADRTSFVGAWYLNTAMGFFHYHDHTCLLYARAVRTTAG